MSRAALPLCFLYRSDSDMAILHFRHRSDVESCEVQMFRQWLSSKSLVGSLPCVKGREIYCQPACLKGLMLCLCKREVHSHSFLVKFPRALALTTVAKTYSSLANIRIKGAARTCWHSCVGRMLLFVAAVIKSCFGRYCNVAVSEAKGAMTHTQVSRICFVFLK